MQNRNDEPREKGHKKYYFSKKKYCYFCKERIRVIDYKESKILERFTMDTGKILPSRVSGVCKYHQNQLTKAIKRARHMAMLKYVEPKRD